MNCPLCGIPLNKRSMFINDNHEKKGCKITYTCTRACGSVVEVNVINDTDYLDSVNEFYEKQAKYHAEKGGE